MFLRVGAITFHVSRFTFYVPLAACLFFSLLAALPLFANPGFLSTRGIGDSPNLLFRVHQLLAAWLGGEFPARWMPDADYGYGFPYFTYYASFSTFIAALLKLYGFSFITALKLTQWLALLAAAGAMYGWLRSVGRGRGAAVLASAAYTFAPFHLVNLYIRGDSLAELWAMAFYPLLLWAAQRCLAQPGFTRAAVLAGTFATFVCTHNISALIFMPFLGLYLLLSSWAQVRSSAPSRITPLRFASGATAFHASSIGGLFPTPPAAAGPKGLRRRRNGRGMRLRITLWSSFAILWGLALAAFFWLPALGESQYVQLSDLTQGYFFYGNHFRGADLVQFSLFFDYTHNPFSMGLLQTLAAGAGLIVMLERALSRRRWTWLDTFVLAGLGLSTLMITPLSGPLWEALPLVRYTQFPWRFLSIQALFTASLTAFLLNNGQPTADDTEGHQSLSAARRWIAVFLSSAAFAFVTLSPLRLNFIPLTDADVNAERLNLYEYFTTAIGNTVNSEYLPRGVRPRPFTSDVMLGRAPRLKALSGLATGARLWKRGSAEQWQITVSGEAPATVAVPTHYWPGWWADVDGQAIDVRAMEGLGWITFDLPPGPHAVTLRLGRTPLRAAAEIVSALAFVLPLAILLYHGARGRFAHGAKIIRLQWGASQSLNHPATQSPSHPIILSREARQRVTLLVLLGILALGFGILHLWPEPAPGSFPLNMDYETLAYPHESVVRFSDGTELLRTDYDRTHLGRRDTLTMRTEWRLNHSGSAHFRLVSPAGRVASDSYAIADATTFLDFAGGPRIERIVSFELPTDILPGVYFLTVEFFDKASNYPAETNTGQGRGTVHLAPVWVDDPGLADPSATSVPLADFGPAIRVLTATVRSEAGPILNTQIRWQALADVPHNYAVALRVYDSGGNEWGGLDTQVAHGFYPTGLWRPGEVIPDRYRVVVGPEGAPPGDYRLALSLYDGVTLRPIGQLDLPLALNLRHPRDGFTPQFQLAPDLALERVEFGGQIGQGDVLLLAAGWLTGAQPNPAYRARWTLMPANGPPLAQTLDLAPSSPPDRWPPESFVRGYARLPIPKDLAPGRYALSVSLVDEGGTAVGAEATVGTVEIVGRARVFVVPALQTEVGATFDEQLKLWGYEAVQTNSELQLNLVWGALAEPRGDYKFFVHLFNPADESVPAQADTMPRNFTYPTSQWAQGEVVTDTVTLNLADVPPGTYSVAVGWYDPNHPEQRLPAFDAQGRPLALNRVILPLVVEQP
jgi:hypothetical protein